MKASMSTLRLDSSDIYFLFQKSLRLALDEERNMSLTNEENLLLSLIINNRLRESAKSPAPPNNMDYTVENPTHTMGNRESNALKIQEMLHQQMLEESEFCDVTLLVGDMKIKAHWCVLVGCPFFQSLHDSGMKESFEGSIRLSYGTPWAMKEALRFLYTGKIEVSYDKVKDLLEAAEYLQVTDLKKCCNNYLHLLDVTDDNCVQLSLLSSLYDLDLYNKCFQYLRGHLPSVLNGNDALTLTKESVMSLLSDETLTYVPQETFLNFVNKWTNQDLVSRREYFSELFQTLKLGNVAVSVLEDNLEHNPLVSNNDACKSKINLLLSKYKSGLISECKDTKKVILLCGGSGPGIYIGHYLLPQSDYMSINSLFGYILDEKRWTKLAPMPSAIRQPSIVCDDDGCIYIYDRAHILESGLLYVYTTKEKTWTSIKVTMPENSENVKIISMFICQNKLFFLASGMICKSSTRSSPTFHSFLLELKKDTGELSVKTFLFPLNANSQVVGTKIGDQHICVMGSKLGDKLKANQKVSSVCICYNVESGKTAKLPKGCNNDQFLLDLNGSIMTARPGKTNTKLFSLGKTRWDLRRDLAIPLPTEQSDRTDYAFIGHKKDFFIFGGKSADKKEPIKSALVFSQESRTWDKLEDVPESVFGSGICVASLPSELVKCHVDCPHCEFKSPRSLATYNCFHTDSYMDEDDDDDDEYSFYGDYEHSDTDLWDDEDDDDDDVILDPDDYWVF